MSSTLRSPAAYSRAPARDRGRCEQFGGSGKDDLFPTRQFSKGPVRYKPQQREHLVSFKVRKNLSFCIRIWKTLRIACTSDNPADSPCTLGWKAALNGSDGHSGTAGAQNLFFGLSLLRFQGSLLFSRHRRRTVPFPYRGSLRHEVREVASIKHFRPGSFSAPRGTL